MKFVSALLLTVYLISDVAWGLQTCQDLEPRFSTASFSAATSMGEAQGTFGSMSGILLFDSINPERSKVLFKIDLTSVNLDKTRVSAQLLEGVIKSLPPRILSFSSALLVASGKRTYRVSGPVKVDYTERWVSFTASIESTSPLQVRVRAEIPSGEGELIPAAGPAIRVNGKASLDLVFKAKGRSLSSCVL